MKILGIDISSRSTGLIILESKGLKILKRHIIKSKDFDNRGFGEYYYHISDTIRYYLLDNVFDVVIEDLNIRFLKPAKLILPIHGIVKEVVYSKLKKEAICYNVSTWHYKILGLKKYTKVEKDTVRKLLITKKEMKKRLDVKNKVIEYVNKVIYNAGFTYEENDLADAAGLTLAYLKDKQEMRI